MNNKSIVMTGALDDDDRRDKSEAIGIKSIAIESGTLNMYQII